MRRVVYHGTAGIYEGPIVEAGIPALPAGALQVGIQVRPSKGVRVRLDRSEAGKDAAAWTAYHTLEHLAAPRGIIVKALVESARIREVDGALRVQRLSPEEITIERVEFPHFQGATVGGRQHVRLSDSIEALTAAVDRWEQLTGNTKTSVLIRRKIR